MIHLLQGHFPGLLSVERAISDLRRGYPVIIRNHEKNQSVLVFSADTVSEEALLHANAALGSCSVVLTGTRIKKITGQEAQNGSGKIPLAFPLDVQNLYLLAGIDLTKSPEAAQHLTGLIESTNALEESALEIVKLAELIPAAIIAPITKASLDWINENQLLTVSLSDIASFKQHNTETLSHVCHAPLCLEGAEEAAIDVYRPLIGGSEHYAITIGNALKDQAPLVRIHSSCYTGDLLRSLKCDCGDQLHEAIHFMGEKAQKGEKNDSGGIIIYLMQEGRGIGLTNKLRAYDLQAQGMDTVDANEVLGFDDDERLFLPAVRILELLGIQRIRLLTNNPRKAKGLEEHGVVVESCVPHIMEPHKHNDAYIQTKANRLGHTIPSLPRSKT